MSYVLGVDGGNTKTDYLLHDLSGKLAAHLRAGTCSHEAIGMEGAKREMGGRIAELLQKAGVTPWEIRGAAFGLAGVDQPLQQQSLSKIIRDIGFENSVVMNDSFLGIKAASPSGVGVCSVNGTGTSAGGIDAQGNWVQVGGLGEVSGDAAGGSYIASRTLCAAYDRVYRFGEDTLLLPMLLTLFDCGNPEDFHLAVSTQYQYGTNVCSADIISTLFTASDIGDAVAVRLIIEIADMLARSAAGCAVRLRFDMEVPVILIGSVWTRGRYKPMIDAFVQGFERYARKACAISILEVPPVAGAVLWALELALGGLPTPSIRENVFTDTSGL